MLRMGEPQVGADVELDEVRARVDGGLQRLERVLRRYGRRAAVTDHERQPVAATQVHERIGPTISCFAPATH